MEVKKIVNKTLVDLILKENPRDKVVLDVGSGRGQLTFEIAPFAGYIIGLDISEDGVKMAKEYAMSKHIKNVEFLVGDAECIEYRDMIEREIDMIVSHLCMSKEIIIRSSYALRPGFPFIFACFQSDQLKELGGSQFSFSEEEMRGLVEDNGFKVEYLGIERWQIKLPSKEEVIRTYKTRRWARKNWNELIKYL
ncbi:MAG: methyltransferase domain-containing protein, partial [Candidatus Hydrothermarchaeales archaeon]